MTLLNKSGDWMEKRIEEDVYRLLKEHEGWSYQFTLAILACRYSSPQFRQKTIEILEKKMKGSVVDPLLGEEVN